jgi:hypothetical protein
MGKRARHTARRRQTAEIPLTRQVHSIEVAGDYAEDLAAAMLATTMGLEFDAESAWDERKQLFMASGSIRLPSLGSIISVASRFEPART